MSDKGRSVNSPCVGPRCKCPVSGIVRALEVDMTCGGTVTVSAKKLNGLEVVSRVIERRLAQRQAAGGFVR